ncbi:DUF1080 domain-containing protein [Aurantibacter crassamenti]|uniref:3-keto-disaccharide hydrolase n=1 Tax=Aurantibacter crassamenti TaxID=1837375 RepID=UPI00193A1DA2|nr:DUF1080 domain-containing protein [Aurantibacter crassamenti]MBM1107899.1 DUF1080 domain-containing protein [Aurantibacter crassamenti]
MKKLFLSLAFILCFIPATYSNSTITPTNATTFDGMWGIDIEGGGVAWLNVHQEQGFLDAELMWIGGSVVPVSSVYVVDENTLVVTRTEAVKKSDQRTHIMTYTMRINKIGETIEGVMTAPDWLASGEKIIPFKGKRMPEMPSTPDLSKIKFGKEIKLFNGKNMKGWTLMNPESKALGFKVVDGLLTNNPEQPKDGKHISYGNIRTDQEFEDFNLKLDVNVPKGDNSGVYLRGLYEIQVADTYGNELDSHNMGALYSRITPSEAAEKPAGEWQTLNITLVDRHVTVIFNGKKIIDNKPVYGPTGGAISSDVLAPGPIYLQGDHGKVSYKNIVLTPIL